MQMLVTQPESVRLLIPYRRRRKWSGVRGPPHPRELGIVLTVGIAHVYDELFLPPRLRDSSAQRREDRPRLRYLQGRPRPDEVVQHVDDEQRLLSRRFALHRFPPPSSYHPRYRAPHPSFLFNTSCTTLGLAFPRLSLMTCPTKKERSPTFPPR